ncbi:MAG TPA: DUF4123 domain-containing protein [Bryobacteraceae bacterium]|nr:DUF4123 domain-containing protein [Bryobacteraceae bacterium]
MTSEQRGGILDTIWPDGMKPGVQTFAILDGARDDRIWWAVDGTFCEHDCLYAGELSRRLQCAAPYLVQLDREDRLTRFILDNGWGQSWGVFFRSDAGLKSVRKHLRGFLRVKDERGNRLLFRYYDPRVLQFYLPTCTVTELQTFFGPIHSFVMETRNAKVIVEMAFNGKALQQTNFSVQQSLVKLSAAGRA